MVKWFFAGVIAVAGLLASHRRSAAMESDAAVERAKRNDALTEKTSRQVEARFEEALRACDGAHGREWIDLQKGISAHLESIIIVTEGRNQELAERVLRHYREVLINGRSSAEQASEIRGLLLDLRRRIAW